MKKIIVCLMVFGCSSAFAKVECNSAYSAADPIETYYRNFQKESSSILNGSRDGWKITIGAASPEQLSNGDGLYLMVSVGKLFVTQRFDIALGRVFTATYTDPRYQASHFMEIRCTNLH